MRVVPETRVVCLILTLLLPVAICHPRGASAVAPILVLTDNQQSTNPFGNYWAEILRGEGLLAFEQVDRAVWSAAADPAALLSSYSAVVMAEMTRSPTDEQLLRGYVQNGGVLIGTRPGSGMSDVFGVQAAGARPEQHLQYYGVNPAMSAGSGITHGALQYHGEASNYQLQGASSLAHLYDDATTPSLHPAVTSNSYGSGQAIAFAFDPAKSVVLTRQGNPDWQNTEGDGIPQYRPHDMFARTDGTTYYDPNRLAIPQADELQRFVANIVIESLERPMPRMWYLPSTHKTIMVNTGDGESNFGTQFDQVLNDAASYGGYFSLYLRDIGIANTTVTKEGAWRAAGHEVGVHMWGGGTDGTGAEAALTQAYGQITASLQSKFGHLARTSRNHTIDWTGWVDMARIEAGFGTQLDTNYYHYLNRSLLNPLTSNGYFTGSGLPQLFIDADGQLLPIYQAATQWPDEWFADAGLTAQQSIDIIKGMFEMAEEHGYYSAFVNNIHPVRYNGSDPITSTWAKAIWEYCQEEGIPMWSGEMLLDFTRARNGSRFNNLTWTDGLLEFDFVTAQSGFDLTLMLPMDWLGERLVSIAADGSPVDFVVEEIKGIEYAMFTTQAAQAQISASYELPSLAGDFNGDGSVDAADYIAWRKTNGTPLKYNEWRENFGMPFGGGGGQQHETVPEPSSWALLAVGSLIPILSCKRARIRCRSFRGFRHTSESA